MKITFLKTPLNTNGDALKVGDKLNSFTVVDKDLNDVKLEDLNKGIKVFLSVPSLDTPVCDMEVRKFNKNLNDIDKVKGIYVVSMDLPFAQSRFCTVANIDKVVALSDYKTHSFSKATNTYINELGLLTRSVIIVDENNKVIYTQYLSEITNEPDYEDVLNFLNK